MAEVVEDKGEVVVLTGASGFVGHQTLKMLIGKDDAVTEVRCVDLLRADKVKLNEIKEEEELFERRTGKRKKVCWLLGDIRDINLAERALSGADCVIHCASRTDIWIENGEQNVEELRTINVEGTENLLKASVKLGVHKFIYVSSFEVYSSGETLYYCTESTLPDTKTFLFGASGSTKKAAESKVREYSNNKLNVQSRDGKDSLNAIIIRFPEIYGEHDKYFVSKILEITKFFGGVLPRLSNVWILHQPVYVGNAAWALIKAKQRMDRDISISGEEFHITDETAIQDPFDFLEPFIQSKGMRMTKGRYPAIPIWLLIMLFFMAKRFLKTIDLFGLFTNKKTRLQEAIERDTMKVNPIIDTIAGEHKAKQQAKHWYDLITPQTFLYISSTSFLNRTKASLRLDYTPQFNQDESKQRSLDWYKNNVNL